MKDSREKSIKRFLCSKTNTKSLNKEKKLYSLLLHEDLYPIFFQNTNSLFVPKGSGKKNIKQIQKGNFLTIKYIISLFRSNKFADIKRSYISQTKFQESEKSKKNQSRKKRIVFHLILESIAFLLLCSQQKKNVSEKLFVTTKHLSISIHKPLESVEKQWQYDSFGFQGRLCTFFHPEILLRILRKKFQDISFLHLIRKILHSNLYLFENIVKESPSNKIRNILWNIYVLEIDNFFVSEGKYYCCFEEQNFFGINHSLSCLQKMSGWAYFLQKKEHKRSLNSKKDIFSSSISASYYLWMFYRRQVGTNIIGLENESDKRRQISFLDKASTYKYFRTNTNWFLFFQKIEPWNLLTKRRVTLFFIRRLGYIFEESPINSTITFKGSRGEITSFFFLAYIFQIVKKKIFVRINTKFFFLMSYFVRRIVCFLNPFYLILEELSKQNFCNSFGSPKSKVGWVTWTDNEIIQQFKRLRNSIFLFYSGCQNTKSLSRIQYILYFSCAKTLACKHKTNLRHIYKKFGQNLRIKDFSTTPSTFLVKNQSKNVRLRFLYNNQKNLRTWNFHLTKLDSIFLHLEDF